MIHPKNYFKDPNQIKRHQTSFIWTIPEDLPYFKGHFPKKPILPAIAIIDFSLEAISIILERKLSLVKIKKAKFSDIISPLDEITIQVILPLDLMDSQQNYKVHWLKGDNKVAELNLTLSNDFPLTPVTPE